MFRVAFIGIAALVAIIAALTALRSTAEVPPQIVYGRNNTVLFVTDNHNGLSNVHVATSFALLEDHPEVEVHYASFPKLKSEIERVSKFGCARNLAAKAIQWHPLPGPNYVHCVLRNMGSYENMLIPPGMRGIDRLLPLMEKAVDPWMPDEHYDLYLAIQEVIREVDPNVVVTDPLVYAALEASRGLNRSSAIISPNDLQTLLVHKQPWLSMFWKYPALGTGSQYPVPLGKIPENIFYMFKFLKAILTSPYLKEKRAFLESKGITNSLRFDPIGYEDVPWISAGFPEGGFPIEVIPPHVVPCGPIAVEVASVEEQDPKLAAWLKKAPTMLFNLGSGYMYSEERAGIIAQSLLPVLEQTEVQILWKLQRLDGYNDDFAAPVKKYIDNGRLRIEKWLGADPLALMKSGDIILSVNHGGAGAFHETILAGIPHVVLPLWADHYNFASMTEYLGLGLWPGKEIAPDWEPEALSEAYLRVLSGEESVSMREKAKELAKVAQSYGGRKTSAAKVASLASQGHV